MVRIMKKTVAILVLVLAVMSVQAETLPLNESFGGPSFPPDGWRVYRSNQAANANQWTQATTGNPVRTAPGSAQHVNPANAPSQRSMLVTKAIEVPDVGFYELSFWSRTGTGNAAANNNTGTAVLVSTSPDSASFTTPLGTVNRSAGGTNSWGAWTETFLSLAEFRGQTIYIAFVYTSPASTATVLWAIDDVVVRPTPVRYVSRTPITNTINVGINQDIVVNFNRDITAGDFDGITVEPAIVGGFTASITDENNLTLSHSGFTYATNYTVTIPVGTIVGFDQALTWSFRTQPMCIVLEPDDLLVVPTRNSALFTWAGEAELYTFRLFRDGVSIQTTTVSGHSLNVTGLPINVSYVYTWSVTAFCGPLQSEEIWGEPFHTLPNAIKFSITGFGQGNGNNLGVAVPTGTINVQNQSDISIPGGPRTFSATLEVNGVIVGTESITTPAAGNILNPNPAWAVNATRNAPTFPTLSMDLSEPGEHRVRIWINDFGALPANSEAVATDTFERVIYNRHADAGVIEIIAVVDGEEIILEDGQSHINLGNAETLRIRVANHSVSDIGQIWGSVTINNTRPHGGANQQLLPIAADTLRAGEDMVWTFPNPVNFTAAGNVGNNFLGTYEIVAWARGVSAAGPDRNFLNDTLRLTITNRIRDLHLINIYYPETSVGLTSAEEARIAIRNTSAGEITVTGATAELWVDNELKVTDNLPDIPAGDSISHLFSETLNLSEFRTYDIKVVIVHAADHAATNDTLRRSVTNHESAFYDVELVATVAPVSGVNLSATSHITVDVQNRSIAALTNVPVTFRVYRDYERTELIQSATETIANLALDGAYRFTFSQTVNLSAIETTNFYFTVFTDLTNDDNRLNDTIKQTITNTIYINYFLSNITIPSGETMLRTISSDAFPVTATVSNQGTLPLIDFPVHFMVNDGTPITGRIPEIPAGLTRQVTVNVALEPWAWGNAIDVFIDENPDNDGTVNMLRENITNEVDVRIIDFSAPTSGDSLTAAEPVRVVLQNWGTFTERNIPITFLIDGEEKTTEIIDRLGGPWICISSFIICLEWAPSTHTHTFEVTADLSEFREYIVTVRLDIPGNNATNTQARTVINNNPNAREVMPEEDAVNILRDTEVIVTFTNRDIEAVETPITGITITYNGGEGVVTDFEASIYENQLIITHDGFDYKTTYTITIPVGTIVGYYYPIVWSFTTIIEIPEAFALTAPKDEATVLLAQELTWEASERAANYRVYFGTEPNPTTYTIVEAPTTSWTPYPALTYDTEYFWHVVAVNAGGETESTSGEQRFMTVFAQLTPEDGAYNILLTQDLTWEAAEGAASYRVYFGTHPNPATYTEVTTTSWIPYPALNYYTEYFWRVVAVDANGETINTSAERSFKTIIEIPGAFALTAPDADAQNVLLTQELTWEASERAVSYRVYFGTEPNPTTYTEVTTTSWMPYPALTYLTTYFWRVVAINVGGETENIAGERSFTAIVEAPGAFALTAPNTRSRNILLDQELTWEASERATSYRVYLGTDPDLMTYTEVMTTSWIPHLAYGTEYFWRVVAVNVGGETSSETWSLTTLPALVVVSTTPYTDATNITLAANLTVMFNREISTTPLADIAIYPEVPGVWIIVSDAMLTIAHGGLSGGTAYTVTIPAGTIADYDEDIVWSFTTRTNMPTDIQPLDPAMIAIFPNPVDDLLHIQTTELIRRTEVYNTQGVRMFATEDTVNFIDVSSLPAGVYIIRFVTESGTITKRFIKR